MKKNEIWKAATLALIGLLATANPGNAQDKGFSYSARYPDGVGFELDDSGCVSSLGGEQEGITYFPAEMRLLPDEPMTPNQNDPSQGLKVTIADRFSLEYGPNYKILENLDHGDTFVLYRCGLPPPAIDSLPERVRNSNFSFFETPVARFSTGLTIPLEFLSQLSVGDRGSIIDLTYVTNPCYHALEECEILEHVSAYNSSFTERIIVAQSELHIVDYFGTGETGLPIDVPMQISGEAGMLERAEWIKFLAAFFNLEVGAGKIFADIVERYNEAAVKNVEESERPLVAFISFFEGFGDSYPQSWSISSAGYKQDLVDDAGGRSLNFSATGTYFDNPNNLKIALEGVNILVDETYAADPSLYSLATFLSNFNYTAEEINSLPFADDIYRVDKRLNSGKYGAIGIDWFESAIANPDLVLLDFKSAIQPDYSQSENFDSRWLRNVARGDPVVPVTSDECRSEEDSCSFVGEPIPRLYNCFSENCIET